MNFANFETAKMIQEQRQQQAAAYRLIRSLEKSSHPLARIYAAIGRALIILGQILIKRTQAAH